MAQMQTLDHFIGRKFAGISEAGLEFGWSLAQFGTALASEGSVTAVHIAGS